ncbi:MAG: TnpV protein [Faecousia sp.]
MKEGLEYSLEYIRSGDYFIPNLTLPEETRPIGKWGRMHWEYLREHKPIQYSCLLLSGKLWTYLADLNQQAQDRLERMIDQMKVTEGVTENLKASDQLTWVGTMNNIRNRAEEIILRELIYGEDMV